MPVTCCLWHAFDIWQIAHSADPETDGQTDRATRAFQMKWLNYVPSGGKWKMAKKKKEVKLEMRFAR